MRLRRVVLAGAIILLILGMAGWRFPWGEYLAIREIEVEGGERIPAETVRRMIPVQAGDNLWRVDVARTRLSLVNATPWIRDARIVKAYPDRLKVILQERKPFVAIELPSRGAAWIDADGYVLEAARPAKIFQPRIRGLSTSQTSLGLRVSDEASLQALRDFFEMEGRFMAQFEDIAFRGSDATLTSRAGFQVYLKNYSVKGDLRLLKRVLEKLDGRKYRYFDLRYSQPIARPR